MVKNVMFSAMVLLQLQEVYSC